MIINNYENNKQVISDDSYDYNLTIIFMIVRS